jgi:hypothetical protein
MSPKSWLRSSIRLLATGTGIAAGAYGAYAGAAWYRYGHIPDAAQDDRDELLDRFMPSYEVVERHYVRVAAPAPATLAAAREQDLLQLPLVRAIFKAREMVLGATTDGRPQPRGLLAAVKSLG